MFLREGNKRQKKIFDNVFGTCAWGWLKPQWKLEAAAEDYIRAHGERSSSLACFHTTTAPPLGYPSRTTYHPRTTIPMGPPEKMNMSKLSALAAALKLRIFKSKNVHSSHEKKARSRTSKRVFSISGTFFSLATTTILDRKFNVSQFKLLFRFLFGRCSSSACVWSISISFETEIFEEDERRWCDVRCGKFDTFFFPFFGWSLYRWPGRIGRLPEDRDTISCLTLYDVLYSRAHITWLLHNAIMEGTWWQL